jgi:hypothetical protein
MPKKPKKPVRKSSGLNEDDLFFMVHGYCLLDDSPLAELSDKLLARVYEKHRAQIMGCVGKPEDRYCGLPHGCRPWSWFEFEKIPGKKPGACGHLFHDLYFHTNRLPLPENKMLEFLKREDLLLEGEERKYKLWREREAAANELKNFGKKTRKKPKILDFPDKKC